MVVLGFLFVNDMLKWQKNNFQVKFHCTFVSSFNNQQFHAMTFQEFKKNYIIYKSHKLAGGFIAITYAYKGVGYVTQEKEIHTAKVGGALKSLYNALNGGGYSVPIRDSGNGKIIGYN
jgi:hypothetical protein